MILRKYALAAVVALIYVGSAGYARAAGPAEITVIVPKDILEGLKVTISCKGACFIVGENGCTEDLGQGDVDDVGRNCSKEPGDAAAMLAIISPVVLMLEVAAEVQTEAAPPPDTSIEEEAKKALESGENPFVSNVTDNGG